MVNQKITKLKKYLFLISIIFLFATFSHLLKNYLYIDSKSEPIKWWTISEWLIGNFPSLNPIKHLSWNNEYVINLLYRSMLKYDLNEKKLVWDLTSCDISSLKRIECYINDDAIWSDWSKVTVDDIYSTYNLIKENNTNIIISSLLIDTQIEKDENIIVFKNEKEDVNFLNIFFQPILPKSTIDNLTQENIEGNFPTIDLIYSWNYTIWNISSDLTIWVSKIILDENPYYSKGNISKLILNIYPNINTFLKNKQSVNVFNDNEFIVWNSIPRLASYKYTMPQFVWLFLNQDKLKNVNLRSFILNKISSENLIELLWEENFEEVNNPYLTETELNQEPNNRNFESIMNSLWYYKKSYLVEKYLPKKETKVISNETSSEENKVINNGNIDKELTIDDFQENSLYISSPDYVDKYNFITKDDILLQWNVTEDIEEVYINDYKLQNFTKWSSEFYYRLKESYDSIKEWINEYEIYFVKWKEKVFKEKLIFIYYKDSSKLEEEKIAFINSLYNQELKEEPEIKINDDLTESEQEPIDQGLLEKINSLDENLYYNDNFEVYTLRMVYINSEKHLDTSANFIINSIKELGMEVEASPISLSNIQNILLDKSSYDMLLTWVNLWYFDFNIFPYFHSSQTETWYNFSNIKKSNLDLLLEDLKSWIINKEEEIKIKEEINQIFKEEQVIKTLYTPKINLLVDKNLNINKVYNYLPNESLRSYIVNSSYIKEQKIINYENKSIFWFIKYMLKIVTWTMM